MTENIAYNITAASADENDDGDDDDNDNNSAVEEESEFDALQFLENFVIQNQGIHDQVRSRPTSNNVESRYFDVETSSPYATRSRSRNPTEFPEVPLRGNNEFRFQEILPPGEPPPRYEDVTYVDSRSSLRGSNPSPTYVRDLPPQYDQVRHIVQTDDNHANVGNENGQGFPMVEDGDTVASADQETGVWSRYEYNASSEYARMKRASLTLWFAIAVTVMCFCPLGVFAIWQATKAISAARRGNLRRERSYGNVAKVLIFGTILFGILIYAILVGFMYLTIRPLGTI